MGARNPRLIFYFLNLLSLFHLFVFLSLSLSVNSLFSSCSGEFFISVFSVSLFTNLFLFAKFFFVPFYPFFMGIIVYLPEDHFGIFVFEDLLCSVPVFPLSPATRNPALSSCWRLSWSVWGASAFCWYVTGTYEHKTGNLDRCVPSWAWMMGRGLGHFAWGTSDVVNYNPSPSTNNLSREDIGESGVQMWMCTCVFILPFNHSFPLTLLFCQPLQMPVSWLLAGLGGRTRKGGSEFLLADFSPSPNHPLIPKSLGFWALISLLLILSPRTD